MVFWEIDVGFEAASLVRRSRNALAPLARLLLDWCPRLRLAATRAPIAGSARHLRTLSLSLEQSPQRGGKPLARLALHVAFSPPDPIPGESQGEPARAPALFMRVQAGCKWWLAVPAALMLATLMTPVSATNITPAEHPSQVRAPFAADVYRPLPPPHGD